MNSKINPSDIQPLDILEYTLGQVTDPERRAAIESTKDSHPELWECLTAKDSGDIDGNDHLELDVAKEVVPEVVADYFHQLAGIREVIDQIGEQIQAEDGPKLDIDQPLMRNWDAERFGGKTVRMADALIYEFGDGSPQQRPKLPEPPFIVPFKGKLYVAQPAKEIPYGVVRIIVSVKEKPLVSIVRVMHFDKDRDLWLLEVSVTEFFGRQVPKEELEYHVQPARQELFAWFPKNEIERLLKKIPADQTETCEKVQQLLDELEE